MSAADEIVNVWLRRLPVTPGGYAENVLSGWTEAVPPGGAVRRMSFTQTRLAYVLLHAAEIGFIAAREPGLAALERARSVFWREDLRGWIRSADERGHLLDATIDTYDQAFGLLACSWDREPGRGGVTARSRLVARAALAGLDEEAADPAHGGYREMRNGGGASMLALYPGFRRQNPHMHLLEAFLSWSRVDPTGPWRERAAATVTLLRTRFMDARRGTLREYFDDAWTPAPGAPGKLLEPGHHFEWVWLLNEYRKLTGDETVLGPAHALYDFAVRTGVDGDGLAFDAVDADGSVVAGTKLLWPQTEQLKAHLAMYEWRGDARALEAARRLLSSIPRLYRGGDDAPFVNQLDRAGRRLDVPTPSRVLYHVFVALVEADRVLGKAS